MKRIILAIGAALTVALGSLAATDYSHKLVVNKSDGTNVKYEFKHIPVASIEGEDLKISLMETHEAYLIPMAELVNITIDREVSGVGEIASDKQGVTFGLTRESVEVSGLTDASEITVCDLNGAIVAKGKVGADGCGSVAIGHLGQGVYIVTAGKNSFKFIR